MKKIFLLFFLCLMLVSCFKQAPTDTKTDSDNVIEEETPNVNTDSTDEVLDTPVLSFDAESSVVSWDEVKDATHYNYIINDGEILTTTSLSLELGNEETISVQAANDESLSEWSYAVTNFDTSDIYEEIVDDLYVKFHNTTLLTKKIKAGERIEEPTAPTKENYTFDNWYLDPYYQEVFDFNQQIYSSTIIYANYIPNDLIRDTYFWVKGDPKMTSTIMSSGTGSNWHFIPMKLNQSNTSYREFFATVTVTGASATNPCCFIVMDGFSDDAGRTYWKNNESDFSITTNGTYNIYFSVEHQYSKNIHVTIKNANNTPTSNLYKNRNMTLDTPVVSIDGEHNLAVWNEVDNATKYEVIIDNGEVIQTSKTSVNLEKGSFITVRALQEEKYSRWSLPKANRNHIIVDNDDVESYSVFFVGYDAYQVEKNSNVTAPVDLSKEGFTFGGWYLDPACTTVAKFPYEVTKNTVFYPKWVNNDDYKNKVYYNLTLSDGTIVTGLTWNLDNYNFDEYETEPVKLTENTEYYVVSTTDSTVKYGPYKVDTTGGYTIYFSEDYTWDGKNVYFASNVKTIYFSCPTGWTDTVYIYIWNGTTNSKLSSWPGVEMTYVETNDYGQKIYKIDIDLSLYDHIVFTHGSNGVATGSQTVDISLIENTDNGFYLTEKNSSGKYQYGTYSR